jgi:hypothetical protein
MLNRLVRPHRVVLDDPRVQRGLSLGERGELVVVQAEELDVQGAAEALHLARGGRLSGQSGEYGAVNRCRAPLSVQIRSKSTGPRLAAVCSIWSTG